MKKIYKTHSRYSTRKARRALVLRDSRKCFKTWVKRWQMMILRTWSKRQMKMEMGGWVSTSSKNWWCVEALIICISVFVKQQSIFYEWDNGIEMNWRNLRVGFYDNKKMSISRLLILLTMTVIISSQSCHYSCANCTSSDYFKCSICQSNRGIDDLPIYGMCYCSDNTD